MWAKSRPWNLIHIQLLRSFIILHSLPLFLLTLPFPMSRRSSQPGDTGNAIYCNTSILSVLSLLLPPLVLSRPAILSPAQGWMQRSEPPLEARSMDAVKCLRAELRAGCFEFLCKTNQLVKLGWNVTTQGKLSYNSQLSPLCIFSSKFGKLDKRSLD